MSTIARNRFARDRGATGAWRFTLALLLASSFSLAAQSDSTELESTTPSNWNTNPAHWERMLEQTKASADLQIGKSNFKLSGPLVDGFRRKRATGQRSLGKRLLGLPLVRLFVPQPMPSPPGGGRYLLWGERDQSWASFSAAPARLGNTDNPIEHEVSGSLISVGLK